MAILGLDAEKVKAICADAGSKGICAAVNFNSPEQIVIAGESSALDEAGRLAAERGAKRVLPLNVSGAFHSPLMADAARGMRDYLEKAVFKKASIPLAMNADGRLHQQPEEIREQLELQLDHPVLWVESMQALKSSGMDLFVECGAGRVLAGLLRRIDRQLTVYATDTYEAIKEVGSALSASGGGNES